MYLLPPNEITVVSFVCVRVKKKGFSPNCFIASAMYSHVLMGFSNLTTGLEIMKGDKEH